MPGPDAVGAGLAVLALLAIFAGLWCAGGIARRRAALTLFKRRA